MTREQSLPFTANTCNVTINKKAPMSLNHTPLDQGTDSSSDNSNELSPETSNQQPPSDDSDDLFA